MQSSPYFSPQLECLGNNKLAPESHIWGPRDYYKSKFYTETLAHFISETGYFGCPNLSSIKNFIDHEYLWPWENNQQWITHCTNPQGLGNEGPYAYRIKLMVDQINELFGEYPDKLEDLIVASQIAQAEALKFVIETSRLKKWRRTGVIWWNMIDGWPQFSDAVVDYYFERKLSFFYIKRVQQPVCIMVDEPECWYVRVVVGNDSCEDAKGSYRIWDADTEETLMEGEFISCANENSEIGRIRVSHSNKKLFLIEWTANGRKFGNHYLLGHPPFSLEKYMGWIDRISYLLPNFDTEKVWK